MSVMWFKKKTKREGGERKHEIKNRARENQDSVILVYEFHS